jgi:integrase
MMPGAGWRSRSSSGRAGTPVGPHGLHGTHAALAVQARTTADVVAAALGHESFAITAASYAKTEAVAGVRTHQIEACLLSNHA